MCCDKCEGKEVKFYCAYCKEPIYTDDKYIIVDGKHYHRDALNPLKNCYFPNDEETIINEDELDFDGYNYFEDLDNNITS